MAKRANSSARVSKSASRWRKRIKVTLCLFLILVNSAFVAGTVYAVDRLNEAAKIVPELQDKMAEVITTPSEIVSSDGQLLRSIATKYRRPVTIENVPQTVINSTLAAEDTRFYNHGGVDLVALGRVAFEALSHRRQTGGSTITMQLAKRVFTSPVQSIDRKMKDMALAAMIEKHLTKDQILELYLNQIFYGEGAYGISAAADVYFAKSLDQLTIAEAALLARCVRRPSDENPFENLRKAIQNRNVVLGIMRDEGMINASEYAEAIEEPVHLRKDRPKTIMGSKDVAPYFVDYVENFVKNLKIDISSGGYRIETTLDAKAQKIADEGVRSGIARNKGRRVNDGAFFLMDNDGRILAMVGGKDYKWSQYNKTVQGGRQPGSSFKPIVYSVGFERAGWSPSSTVDNGTTFYTGTRKSVSGGGPYGHVSIITALTYSYNRAAVQAIQKISPQSVVAMAKNNFGYWNNLPPYESLALGSGEVTPFEMAQAYSAFQSASIPGQEGKRVEPFGITRIIGPTGEVLYSRDVVRIQAVSKGTAEDMDTCLRSVVTRGTGRAASGVTNARGKTGTTNDNKDAWFCGYTDRFVAIMWIGNPRVVKNKDGSARMVYDEMSPSAMGGKVSCPIWADIMKKIQKELGETKRNIRTSLPRSNSEEELEREPETEPDTTPIPEEVAPTTVDVPPGTDPVTRPGEEAAPVGNGTTTGGNQGTGSSTGGERTSPPPVRSTTGGGSGGGESTTDYVTVEICADSRQRASIYCPERVPVKFPRGREPKGRCPIHGR